MHVMEEEEEEEGEETVRKHYLFLIRISIRNISLAVPTTKQRTTYHHLMLAACIFR